MSRPNVCFNGEIEKIFLNPTTLRMAKTLRSLFTVERALKMTNHTLIHPL